MHNGYLTPSKVLDAVRDYGPIVLDPCTEPDNPTGANYFFTREEDGLKQNWRSFSRGGLIFINPPYSFPPAPDPKRKKEWRAGLLGKLRETAPAWGADPKTITSPIAAWAAKIHMEAKRGAVIVAVLPCGARYSTAYWQRYILTRFCSAKTWVEGRVSFVDTRTGLPAKGNNYDTAIYGFNVSPGRFAEAFGPLGATFALARIGGDS